MRLQNQPNCTSMARRALSAPRIEASTAAAVHHADPAADIRDIGGVLAAPVLSMFQIDAVNLKFVTIDGIKAANCVADGKQAAWEGVDPLKMPPAISPRTPRSVLLWRAR
jgi:hypothetical protein